MPSTQPVSRAVNVAVQITPAAAQSQSLNSFLYIGNTDVVDVVERYRTYASLAAVAADFGTTADEYKAANRWFSQTPQPTSFLIGRWADVATKSGLKTAPLTAAQQLMSAWTGITTGSFSFVRNGTSFDITTLNFSGAANMNAIAALIQARILTVTTFAITVTWNAVYNRFEFADNVGNAVGTFSFLAPAASGVDISAQLKGQVGQGGYVVNGAAAETLDAALATFDNQFGQRFYGVGVSSLVVANILAAAAYIEAAGPKHVLFITSMDANALLASSTTDIIYQLKALGYKRTFMQYSSTAQHAAISAAARLLAVDYEGSGTTITLKYKQEPGVVAENLSVTQALALEAKNCNVFIAYENGTNILEQGVMASGDFADVITGADWLATTMQRDVWNLFYTSTTKIPQTDDGANLVQTALEARCAQAVTNGLAAAGVWNAGGFGALTQGDYVPKGYYVYIAPLRLQTQADRTLRKCPPAQVALKLAGAIHSADVTININQ